MSLRQFFGLAALTSLASACAPELYKRDGDHPHHIKRQNIPNVIEDTRGWSFELADEWNVLKPEWGYCFNGTQQSPLKYSSKMGLSSGAAPVFNYPETLNGSFNNWDFGPQFLLDKGLGNTNTDLPSMQFEENGKTETVYFRSWHTHSPAEHSIDGWRPKAELHFVHYTADGIPRAVVTFLIDRHVDATGSKFFSQLASPYPDFRANQTMENVNCNLNLAIEEIGGYNNFFTYQGSLTTPPCAEGLRWFVSTDLLLLSDVQMQELLTVSTFSARPEFAPWQHNVNAI